MPGLPRWVPFVRRPPLPVPPPPESRAPHFYWFSAVCLVLLLVRLWAWRASWRRARKAARLEAERATKASRSAARHRQADESHSTDVVERLDDCLRLYREVRVNSARRRCPGDSARPVSQPMLSAAVLTGRGPPAPRAGRPSISRRASTSTGCARTCPRPTSR